MKNLKNKIGLINLCPIFIGYAGRRHRVSCIGGCDFMKNLKTKIGLINSSQYDKTSFNVMVPLLFMPLYAISLLLILAEGMVYLVSFIDGCDFAEKSLV